MSIGRPTFQLLPERLRNLRKEAGLTQSKVAREVHRLLGKPGFQALVAEKHYQRIERTGKTSAKMADAIATVLKTTVAVLRGEAPDPAPDLISALETQLQKKLSDGADRLLLALMVQHEDCDRPVRSAAIELAEQIEAAQIGQHPALIDSLSAITGWTHSQLMQPASVHGHWLVTSTMRSGRTAKVVTGCATVMRQIEAAINALPDERVSDGNIVLSETLPWIRIEILSFQSSGLPLAFSFVRCEVGTHGLMWADPNWRDRIIIDHFLHDLAYRSSNFVTDRDGRQRPSDLRRLRLIVEASDGTDFKCVLQVEGNLRELQDEDLQRFSEVGESHMLAMNRLGCDLLSELSGLMASHPLDDWEFIPADRQIRLELRVPDHRKSEQYLSWLHCMRNPYRIRLMEETDEGLQDVPWCKKSVADLADELRMQQVAAASRGAA